MTRTPRHPPPYPHASMAEVILREELQARLLRGKIKASDRARLAAMMRRAVLPQYTTSTSAEPAA